MPFNQNIRYFAFDASLLASATELRDGLGELASTAPDHNGDEIQTLLACVDNAQTGKLRALVLGATVKPLNLTDGRYCIGGLWSIAASDAFESGQIDGEELTVEEVKALTSTEEI